MLTTADGAGVGSPRSGRRALPERAPRGRGGGRRAGSFRRDDKGGDEVRKRSWVWRLAAVVAALALALGLAACGDDDDSGDSSDTSGGDATTLDVAYVTTQQHPYGIAVDALRQGGERDRPAHPQPPAGLPAERDPAARRRAQRRRPDGHDLERDLGHRRHHRLPGAAGAVPDHQLPASPGRSRAARSASRCSPTPTSRPATSSPSPSTRAACASRSARKTLVSVDDFEGTTIRAPQSQVLAAGFQALGANVEPLPLPDVYQALQNGTVDGVEANLPLIYTAEVVRGRPSTSPATSTSGPSRPCWSSTRRSTTASPPTSRRP